MLPHTNTQVSSQIERVGSQDWSWLLNGCPSLSGGSIHPSVRLLPCPSYSEPGVTNYLVPVFWAQSQLHLLMLQEFVENLIFRTRYLFVLAYIQPKSINIHCLPFPWRDTEIIEQYEMTHSLHWTEKGRNEQFDQVKQNSKLDLKIQTHTYFLCLQVPSNTSVWSVYLLI